MSTKRERVEKVNELLLTISGCGRRFFHHNGTVARMEVDARGRVWHHDAFSGKRIYTHHSGRWRGFTNGGTLRDLICRFQRYIVSGERLPAAMFGPYPDWYSGGDPWGYGVDNMAIVRSAAAAAGLLEPAAEAA